MVTNTGRRNKSIERLRTDVSLNEVVDKVNKQLSTQFKNKVESLAEIN